MALLDSLKNNLSKKLLIIFIGAVFFIPFLGKVHLFDWDEINFAEAAREMIVTGDYLTVRIDYQPFHEKPPLFIWMQAGAMKIFGVNEFAARFPNAVIGIITLLVIFSIGNKLFGSKFGWYWVLAFLGSFLPHFYFKSGIIDPTFNLFIFLGLYFLSRHNVEDKRHKTQDTRQILEDRRQKKQDTRQNTILNQGGWKNVLLAGIFVGLAILTKGPVGYLLPVLCWIIFVIIKKEKVQKQIIPFLVFSVISFLPIIVWSLLIIFTSKADIFGQFINYQLRLLTTQDAGHGGPIYYHFVILLIGCFPASIILLGGLSGNKEDNSNQKLFRIWMLILLCVVLVVFSIVKTKIIHYSSLAYFPITFLAAYSLYKVTEKGHVKAYLIWILAILGIIWAGLLTALPLVLMNVRSFLPMVKDKFTYALLTADVKWGGYEWFIGIFYLLVIIIAVFMLIKKKMFPALISLYGGTAVTIFVFLLLIAPKIECYTQGAPIEFEKRLKNKDCYVQVLGFKSYAHYFYAEKRIQNSPFGKSMNQENWDEWQLNGKIDKPAYFIAKITEKEKYMKNPNLKLLYEKNGFLFLSRKLKSED
jgi:4-amino-4-deoxy-L-arabinose transferase-like glycosyltransferase